MEMEAKSHLFEAITDAGIDPVKARRIERAISEDQTNRLMTKEDGLHLELRLEQKLDALRSDVHTKLDALRSEMNVKVETVRSELETLRSDLLAKLNTQIMWYVGSMIAIAAVLVALLHK